MASVDYDAHDEASRTATTIEIDPEYVWLGPGAKLVVHSNTIVTQIQGLFRELKRLEIGWAGRDATEAQAFMDQLKAALAKVFGREGQKEFVPGEGALPKLVSGVGMVAKNYGWTEENVRLMWEEFIASLDSHVSTPDDGARNLKLGPIRERN